MEESTTGDNGMWLGMKLGRQDWIWVGGGVRDHRWVRRRMALVAVAMAEATKAHKGNHTQKSSKNKYTCQPYFMIYSRLLFLDRPIFAGPGILKGLSQQTKAYVAIHHSTGLALSIVHRL